MIYDAVTIERIIQQAEINNTLMLNAEKALIRNAYALALKYHDGQKRLTGESYIYHSLRVAYLVAVWGLDYICICAAILHDVVEDTAATVDDLESSFPIEIVDLVDSLTAPEDELLSKEECDRLYDIKLVEHMNRKVLLIKTADRLDNLYTIESFPQYKKIAKCDNTRDYILPLLKLSKAFTLVDMVEDALIKVEHPERYAAIEQWYYKELASKCCFNNKGIPKTDFIVKFNELVSDFKKINDLSSANNLADEIAVRLSKSVISVEFNKRTVSSLYRQNVKNSDNFFKNSLNLETAQTPLFDVVVRIQNESSPKDVFKDLNEKYFSLLGVVFCSEDQTSYGDSSLYLIKDADGVLYRMFIRTDLDYWRNKIGDIVDNKKEFDLKNVDKIDPSYTYNKKISVYLRDGARTWITEGTTVLDLAFQIHTELGLSFDFAFVDGSSVKRGPGTKLKEGDQVVIMPSKHNDIPKLNWFKYVNTPKAKEALIHYFSEKYKTA